MATVIVYTRRAKRVHKEIVYTRKAKRVHKEIPRRSLRLQNLYHKNRSTQSLRRLPRLKAASFSDYSKQNFDFGGLVQISKISNVEDLLKTGFFDGVQVTCYSKDRQGNLLGIIKGGGFLCGCSQCDYNGEVLSAKMFEKHAGANTKTQADHIFFNNGFNLYKVSQLVRNIPEEDASVKILKLRGDLKQEHLSEELRCDPTNIVTARRSKRKRRERGFQRSIALVENDRDVHLHKRIFEVGGLPDGTALTCQHHNKVLLFGVKQGSVIKCACDNYEFTPPQFEAHAGMGQRCPPYRNIYNSDGKTLHEVSLELPDVPRSSSGISYSRPTIRIQHKKDHYFPTSRKLQYVLQSLKGVSVQCTICKERRATLGDEADPKLVIFCNQCDRAYHIGCVEDQELLKIEDVFNGNWFCCTDCTWVHDSLKKICALGAKPVPTPFFDLLKKPHTIENNLANLSWQIFRGGNTEDQVLLLQSLQFLKSVFKPILLGRKEMLRQMVFGKQVKGTGIDFRGVHFIVIKLNGEIVSIAVLRVFGKYIAELPLATTSKVWRQQGYFRLLLDLIEELLRLLQVRLLVSPVANKMQSIWTDKFGFVKASDQKVQMLKEQHGVMLFEDTVVLVKEIQAVDD